MPTKKSKSNVARSASKPGSLRFRWWMALALVVIVAGIGIAVLRYSHAASPVAQSVVATYSLDLVGSGPVAPGSCNPVIRTLPAGVSGGMDSSTVWCQVGSYSDGTPRWVKGGTFAPCYYFVKYSQGMKSGYVAGNDKFSGRILAYQTRTCYI